MNMIQAGLIGAMVFAFGLGLYFYVPTLAQGFLEETGGVDLEDPEDMRYSEANISFGEWITSGNTSEFWMVEIDTQAEAPDSEARISLEYRENDTSDILQLTKFGFNQEEPDITDFETASFLIPPEQQFRLIDETSTNTIVRSHRTPIPTQVMRVEQPDSFDWIDFNPQEEDPDVEKGRLWYNDDKETFSFWDDNDVRIDLGMDVFRRVKNIEDTALERGEVVRVVGSTGQNPEVIRADSSGFDNSTTFAVIKRESIPENGVGKAITFGRILDMDTSQWDAGDELYLDPENAGQLTTDRPSFPNHAVRVAIVIRSDSEVGEIAVDIEREIRDERMRDVIKNDSFENPEEYGFVYISNTSDVSKSSLPPFTGVSISAIDRPVDVTYYYSFELTPGDECLWDHTLQDLDGNIIEELGSIGESKSGLTSGTSEHNLLFSYQIPQGFRLGVNLEINDCNIIDWGFTSHRR